MVGWCGVMWCVGGVGWCVGGWCGVVCVWGGEGSCSRGKPGGGGKDAVAAGRKPAVGMSAYERRHRDRHRGAGQSAREARARRAKRKRGGRPLAGVGAPAGGPAGGPEAGRWEAAAGLLWAGGRRCSPPLCRGAGRGQAGSALLLPHGSPGVPPSAAQSPIWASVIHAGRRNLSFFLFCRGAGTGP